ncbi:unnamed protein product [Phaeothamnion confervicola]
MLVAGARAAISAALAVPGGMRPEAMSWARLALDSLSAANPAGGRPGTGGSGIVGASYRATAAVHEPEEEKEEYSRPPELAKEECDVFYESATATRTSAAADAEVKHAARVSSSSPMAISRAATVAASAAARLRCRLVDLHSTLRHWRYDRSGMAEEERKLVGSLSVQ